MGTATQRNPTPNGVAAPQAAVRLAKFRVMSNAGAKERNVVLQKEEGEEI